MSDLCASLKRRCDIRMSRQQYHVYDQHASKHFDKRARNAANVVKLTDGTPSLSPSVLDNNRVYRAHLSEALSHVFITRADFAALFSTQESSLAQALLTLSDDALGLLARLLQRKGPWFKTNSLAESYFSHHRSALSCPYAACREALSELVAHGVVRRLGASGSCVDEALCAAQSALSAAELQSVLRAAKLEKCHSAGTKRGAVQLLRNFAQKQQPIFGAPPPVARLVSSAAAACGGLIAVDNICAGLVNRAMALFYLTCADSLQQSHGAETNADKVNPNSNGNTATNHDGALGTTYAAQARSGLLQKFGKIRFQAYNCKITCPVFASRKQFDLYCVSVALQAISEQRLEQRYVSTTKKTWNEDVSLFDLDPGLHGVGIADKLLNCDAERFAAVLQHFLSELELEASCSAPDSCPLFLQQFSAESALVNGLAIAAESLEKQKAYASVVLIWRFLLESKLKACVEHRRRAFWWNRLSVDLKHEKDITGAIEACVACLLDVSVSSHNAHRVEAHKRLAFLVANTRNQTITAAEVATQVLEATQTDVLESKVPVMEIFGRSRRRVHSSSARCSYISGKEQDTQQLYCNVEQFVLEHHELNGGWYGKHCEGAVFKSLFALLMWEAIFDDSIPDVFQTLFQGGPLDLWQPNGLFVRNRAEKIARILESIKTCTRPQLALKVQESWNQHHGTYVVGHHWEKFAKVEIECIAACLGPTLVAAVLERLAGDFAHWGGGGPDLVLYRITPPKGKCKIVRAHDKDGNGVDWENGFKQEWRYECKFIEVKSKNDRLSEKQIAWIIFLNKHGADASVCKVTEQTKAHEREI